eukprot:c24956_g1_i1 orf=1-1488(-)
MRSKLFMVLALWVLCECWAWGGQEGQVMRQQGMPFFDVVDKNEEGSLSFVNGTAADKTANIVRHVVQMSSHHRDVANGTNVNKQAHAVRHAVVRRSLHDRHVINMLFHNRGGTGQHGTSLLNVVDDTAADKQPNKVQHVVIRMVSHYRHVIRTLSHDRGWLGKGNMLSLEPANRTSADKQANAVQLSDVHMPSHGRHVGQMLRAERLLLPYDSGWGVEHHTLLLDVVDETAADKQANAVRRQGVDSALLRYAGLKLSTDTRTGVIFNVDLPPTLLGIQAEATRLNPSRFKQDGLTFNEFGLPRNVSFVPISAFVVLVYRKISNFTVYTLPSQYQFGGPVVGIISSPSNTTFVDSSLPQASISLLPNTFINISLPMFSTNRNANALCAFFSSNGSIFVSKLASLPNFCVSSTLGDFALIVQASSTPSPAQDTSPSASTANGNAPPSSSSNTKRSNNWKFIVGVTCLILAGVALLVALVLISIRLADRVKRFFTTRFA